MLTSAVFKQEQIQVAELLEACVKKYISENDTANEATMLLFPTPPLPERILIVFICKQPL